MKKLDQAMRWAQLALVEDDPMEFDLDFWLAYFRRVHAEGACLSAGGYVAYYPTDIPLHHRSAWLGESDPFGDLVRGCREMGMAVLARTDPHAIHQEAADAHPDWVAVGADGQPRRHWSTPSAWVTCALGPYNFEFMTEVHREIVARYRVDGIFSNRWAGHGLCYCWHCRRNFEEYAGLALPRDRSLENPAWRAYLLWRQGRLFELLERWDRAIQEVHPPARYIPNSGGGALSTLDMVRLSDLTPLLFADRQARQGILPVWANGKNAKEFRAAYGDKPVGGMFSIGLEEKYRWKDSVQSKAELRAWMAEAVANGMRPWFVKFCAKVFDDRWLDVVADFFDWHKRNESYLKDRKPLVQVGLVYSQRSAAWVGGEEAQERIENPILGAYQSLIESRIPFEMLHDSLLDEGHLEGYKVLVLPNLPALSNAQCDQLRAFVARGGGLVATWETSLYDENGMPRANFGLADLFGANLVGTVEGPLKNTYLNVEPTSPAFSPILDGLADAQRIIHGAYRTPVDVEPGLIPPPLTLVPAYPDLPMEEVYPRQQRTGIPGLVLRQAGHGRVAYFPWDIARTFWEVLNPDLGLVFANTVRWALNVPPIIHVEGPGLLDVTVWQQEKALAVHIVNLTNPMAMRGAFRESFPVGPLQVQIRLPDGMAESEVELLCSGLQPEANRTGGILSVTVPSVSNYEVIAVHYEGIRPISNIGAPG